MATAIKHKQRSRRVWRSKDSVRKSFFNICDRNALVVIQRKMLNKGVM